MREVLVVGGGAAGMAAALFAARAGADVTILEHNEKLGKKIYITGKGRCNLTNDCGTDEFLGQVARNPRFLYSALRFFSPQDMMALTESGGCPVVVQRGRRVFPASEKASDVTKALSGLMAKAGVKIRLGTEVRGLLIREGRIAGVTTAEGREMTGDAVILCTGGVSYPATGSTGDGYRLATEAGHSVASPAPVLVGLDTRDEWPRTLQGLSLRNVTLTLKAGKKTLYTELGEMLFTHFGISGPLVLEASCHLPEKAEDAALTVDLKPGLTREQLDARLRRDFAAAGKKMLRTELGALLPGRMAEVFPRVLKLPESQMCSQITGEQRQALIDALKELPIPILGPRPVEEAIVTRGGVNVREVNPATMESKLVPGLYFAGEVLDVDAHTGGYNLQIAWSTGALAGHSAGEEDT